MISKTKSIEAFSEAVEFIPGGVNSPVRAFKQIDQQPLFIDSARGSSIIDIDGNEFIDYCLSWGVFVQGHSHPEMQKKLKDAIAKGTSFGAPTLLESAFAKRLTDYTPSMEKVRLVNSGTEAVMSALRLARGYTGRNIIVKFDGCYHGHADHLLVKSGSGVAETTNSSSSGIPKGIIDQTISVPFNNAHILEEIFHSHGNTIAAVIVEPVPANMGLIVPKPDFLTHIRNLCNRYGSLLIFDEVITGFRYALSSAQGVLNVEPDITCFGKIIGGGFSVGAYGASREIMAHVAPEGNVYQAGTLSGNPIAITAGLATLDIISSDGFYISLLEKASRFHVDLAHITDKYNITSHHYFNMFSLFFTDEPVRNYDDVQKSNHSRFAKFYLNLLDQGIYLAPSPFETNFISSAHSDEDLEKTLIAIEKSLKHSL